MLGLVLSRTVSNVFGTLYPAYMSYKAIASGNAAAHKQWLMFWIVNTAFTILELFGDALVSWLPLYYEAKIGFLLWLALPRFQGATIIYERFVSPILDEYEKDIDGRLEAVKGKVGETLGDIRKASIHHLRSKTGELIGIGTRMLAQAQTGADEGEEGDGADGARDGGGRGKGKGKAGARRRRGGGDDDDDDSGSDGHESKGR